MNLKLKSITKEQLKTGMLLARQDEGSHRLTLIGMFREWLPTYNGDGSWNPSGLINVSNPANKRDGVDNVMFGGDEQLTILVDEDEKDATSPLYAGQYPASWVSASESSRVGRLGFPHAYFVPVEQDVQSVEWNIEDDTVVEPDEENTPRGEWVSGADASVILGRARIDSRGGDFDFPMATGSSTEASVWNLQQEKGVPTLKHDNTPQIGVSYQFIGDSPIPAVLDRQELFKNQWHEKPDSYWLAKFIKSIGQLSSALAEGDEMLTDLELRDIGSICLNWLVKRSKE